MSVVIGEVSEREEGVIEWAVRNFYRLPAKVDELYLSPSFSYHGVRWHLTMYPNGAQWNKSEGYVPVFLIRASSGPPIQVNGSIGLKTPNNEVAGEIHYTHNFEGDDYDGSFRFIKRSELVQKKSELAPSGHLTWVCRMKHPEFTDAAAGKAVTRKIFRRGMCATPTAKCAHCKKTVDAGSLWSHMRKCVEKPNQCPECSDIVALKDWYAHECQPAKAKGAIPSAKRAHCSKNVDVSSHKRKWVDKPPERSVTTEYQKAKGAIPSAKRAHCAKNVDVSSHKRKWVDKPPERSGTTEYEKAKGDNSASGSVVKSKLHEDLKQLLQNQENCDVVLRVKGREFPAHKAILTARSSVFASAFRNDMNEKATVDVKDGDPAIFSDFLRFLYCEDVGSLSKENVFTLFTSAEQYEISDLRKQCIEFMKENLSVDTFCDILTLALRHSDKELTPLTTDFFVTNVDKIIATAEWQIFLAENPTQSNELFRKFVSSVKH